MPSSWSSVMAARASPAHCGTGAGASSVSHPRRTHSPTSAWVTLLAIDHETSAVPGPAVGPYASATSAPRCTTTSARCSP